MLDGKAEGEAREKVNVAEVFSFIRSGDLLAFSGTEATSRFIRFWSSSKYSHVALVIWVGSPVNRLAVCDAVPGEGVRLVPIESFTTWPGLVEHFRTEILDRGRMVESALSRWLHPYPNKRQLLRSFGSYGKDPGQFIYPTDVAVITGADGVTPQRIYVSEYGGNDRICAFDGEARFLFSFGAFGSSADPGQIEFNRPQSLAVARDPKGTPSELVVTDSRNHRLGRFTLDGALIAWIGSPDTPGDALGQFLYPYGIALLADGTALISEYGNNRVQRIDLASGRGLQVWGRPGRGDGDLATPWGIAVIGDRTFVLDTGNNRLVSFPTPKGRT